MGGVQSKETEFGLKCNAVIPGNIICQLSKWVLNAEPYSLQ